jgi:hypothetical protein
VATLGDAMGDTTGAAIRAAIRAAIGETTHRAMCGTARSELPARGTQRVASTRQAARLPGSRRVG